jgi:hypothetical protein
MGRYAYWIEELIDIKTPDDAVDRLDLEKPGPEKWGLSIEARQHIWAVCDRGRPQFWRESRQEAERLAAGHSWTVSYFEEIWLVNAGDQYLFTAPTQQEAEGFIFGMLAYSVLNPRLTSG